MKDSMKIIEKTTEFWLDGRSAVAIGKFDGVHLGHRKLLHKITEQKSKGLQAVVFTFDTSAAAFFGGADKELTTLAEKRRIFEAMGVDVLIEFPLNRDTAATKPQEFIQRYLASQMHTAYICAGDDLSFGYRGAGNYELLEQYAGAFGYRAELIDKVAVGGAAVSSTRVREAVRKGDMESAARMLGMPYSVSGIVEHGRQLGRTIGMPTANIVPDADKLLPPNGVYYSRAVIGDRICRGISNVGCRPTVSEDPKIGVETYLYDFADRLYGQDITVQLLAYRRPEMRFDSLESLKAQMEADIAAGRDHA